MYQLYGYFRSSATYRVRIALHHKSIPFENIEVHLVNNGGEQHQANYTSLNPQALVPTLAISPDRTLTQSMAILHFLEAESPQSPLLPTDNFEQSQVLSFCHQICCEMHPLNNLRVLQYLSNTLEVSNDQKSAWYQHWLNLGLEALEKTLSETAGDFCFGDSLTWADCCLIPQLYNAHRFEISLTPYPTIAAIEQNCLALPSMQAAHPEKYQAS